jgi:metal-responsive CopG/Arc/MetJ family transcriptional regulator
MARLNPVTDKVQKPNLITSVNLNIEMIEKLKEEMTRIGIASRSDLIRMILEEYFKEEIV